VETNDKNFFLFRNTIHVLVMQDWCHKSTLMVYEVLSDLSHWQEIDIGYSEIGKKTGLNRQTIRRSINLLIKHEYIRISSEYERGKQCRGYQLLKPTHMNEIKGLKVSQMKRIKNETIKGIKNETIKGIPDETYLNTNTHRTQKNNKKGKKFGGVVNADDDYYRSKEYLEIVKEKQSKRNKSKNKG